jgi:hypothetical protein
MLQFRIQLAHHIIIHNFISLVKLLSAKL